VLPARPARKLEEEYIKVEAFTISATIKKGIAKQTAAGSQKRVFKS